MDDVEYKKKLKKFIIPLLRRGSYRWPDRNEALKLARVERGMYKCANCEQIFRNKEVQIDHVEPVVPLAVSIEGQTWDSYIERMFCQASGYQILCSQCHTMKSSVEVQTRKQNRQLLKKPIVKKKKR